MRPTAHSERLVWRGAATQLTPLVREHGLLVVSDQRVYFQPLHNVSGTAVRTASSLGGTCREGCTSSTSCRPELSIQSLRHGIQTGVCV